MKPRLLFISQCLPYPPHSGVTNRTYHILKGLSASFDITLLAFTRKNHQAGPEDVLAATAAIERLGVRVRGPYRISSERSRAAKLAVHGASLISGKAYTHFEYSDRAFTSSLERTLADRRPDLVHVDTLDLHRWLPKLEDLLVACTHHSIESDLLRRRAEHERSAFMRFYVLRQAERMESVEREWCPRFSLNVMMSDLDAARLKALAPTSTTFVAPNGVNLESDDTPETLPTVRGRVAFLGPSYLLPNFDGVEFFLREIWHRIRHARPDATFHVIGKVLEQDRLAFESYPGVTCTGFVRDIRPALAAAECFVVPLRIGGGTRLKILDAWSMSRAVVSTSVGCEGLRALDGKNILIRDTPESFADAVVRLLGDVQAQRHLGDAARQCAVEHYSWAAIGESLAKKYHSLIGIEGGIAKGPSLERLRRA